MPEQSSVSCMTSKVCHIVGGSFFFPTFHQLIEVLGHSFMHSSFKVGLFGPGLSCDTCKLWLRHLTVVAAKQPLIITARPLCLTAVEMCFVIAEHDPAPVRSYLTVGRCCMSFAICSEAFQRARFIIMLPFSKTLLWPSKQSVPVQTLTCQKSDMFSEGVVSDI